MSNRKTAYGAPPEEREVLVTVDKRVLYAGGVLVLVLALLGGVWFARSSGGPSVQTAANPAAQPSTGGQGAQPAMPTQKSDEEIRAEMAALGLPTQAMIVQSVQNTVMTPDPAFATQMALITPASAAGPVVTPAPASSSEAPWEGLEGGAAATIEIPESPKGANWTHDVLANFPDQNLADPKLVPELTEKVKQPLKGPRIGISGLSDLYTYDFGVVSLSTPSQREFEATNVGDADLIISRVYTGCGCTTLSVGDMKPDPAGFLKPPIVLKPGESVPFTVEFDPKAEGKPGTMAKFVQIFSNDPTKTLYEANDPNSAEVRFRFVVEPRGKLSATATPTVEH
jgi:hypothetical protein